MKRILILCLSFIFYLIRVNQVLALEIDISASTIQTKDKNSIMIWNIFVPELEGHFWGRITWDPQKNAFVPVDAGEYKTFTVEENPIEKGKLLFMSSNFGGTGTCYACHPAGNSNHFKTPTVFHPDGVIPPDLFGLKYVYPKKGKDMDGSDLTLVEMINMCITMFLRGKALDANSEEAKALVAYFESQGDADKGRRLFKSRQFIGPNSMEISEGVRSTSCESCHPGGGAGMGPDLTGIYEKYPKDKQTGTDLPFREGVQSTLADFTNFCIVRPMNGAPLEFNSKEMMDLVAYQKTLGRSPAGGEQISFSKDILSIFNNNCTICHPGIGAANLDLSSYDGVMRGGVSGPDEVMPGNADTSRLIARIEGRIQPRMPLGRNPLPPENIQMIRSWIEQGALNN